MRGSKILLAMTAWLLATPFAFASANVDCAIDDKNVKFELEAIAGRSGPINQVNGGSFILKPAKMKPLQIKREHIAQQWIVDDDLRLQVVIESEDPNGNSFDLRIVARLDKKRDTYSGNYVLTMIGSGAEREFKGKIKSCGIG
jgi:hypothetical protein